MTEPASQHVTTATCSKHRRQIRRPPTQVCWRGAPTTSLERCFTGSALRAFERPKHACYRPGFFWTHYWVAAPNRIIRLECGSVEQRPSLIGQAERSRTSSEYEMQKDPTQCKCGDNSGGTSEGGGHRTGQSSCNQEHVCLRTCCETRHVLPEILPCHEADVRCADPWADCELQADQQRRLIPHSVSETANACLASASCRALWPVRRRPAYIPAIGAHILRGSKNTPRTSRALRQPGAARGPHSRPCVDEVAAVAAPAAVLRPSCTTTPLCRCCAGTT